MSPSIYNFQLPFLRLASRETEGGGVGGKWVDVFFLWLHFLLSSFIQKRGMLIQFCIEYILYISFFILESNQ